MLYLSKFILCTVVISLFTGCVSRGPKNTARAKFHLQIGTAHLSKGNYPAALAELLTAEKLDEQNPVIQNNLGLAYFVRKKYNTARLHIEKAIKLKPNYTDAKNNLGRIFIEMGLYKPAIKTLKEASHDLTYQEPEKILSTLGWAYFMNKDFELARQELSRSLKIRRKNCITNNLYGRTLFEMKEYQIAADSFDQTLEVCDNLKRVEPLY